MDGRPGDILYGYMNNEKAGKLLGFNVKYTLLKGLIEIHQYLSTDTL
jgi:hypothetical protein